MNDRPDICFVSSMVYGYLNPDEATKGGGAERQQYMIGKKLLENGHIVSYITCSDHKKAPEYIDGFEVWGNLPESNGSLFAPYRLLKLMQIMRKVKAKKYYVRGNPFLCISVALISKILGQSFIYAVANDANVDPSRSASNQDLLRRLYIWAIDQADHVTTLTESQKRILDQEYGISATVVPCGYSLPVKSDIQPPYEREYVLWVGRLTKEQKRPERYLKIVEEIPDIDFVMIGPPSGDRKWDEEIRRRASELENLTFKDFVPPDEIHKYYQKASVLVSTSEYEGFGNVFLEAWCYQTPVISLRYTIDGIISNKEVGIHSSTMDQIVDDISALHHDEDRRQILGKNGRQLVSDEFSIDEVTRQLEELIA
ncbi:glycosyltransferase family 4 protein [Natrialbaceae archaeon A-CW2]